uniref:Chemosensory protein 3 n=1 Tax=Laodelphax striatellus TaxID=195883 RepID=A0A096W1J9_LAOST|nr:chemosensory protein 3 [Laodelphax striatellus]
MKLALFCCLLGLVIAVSAEKYTTKYDHINVEEILNNERLFNSYYKCLMGGKCTPDGLELRTHLPDALRTNCSKCSEKQKEFSDKVIRYLIDNKPEEFAALTKKYDPEGIYKTTFGPQFKKDNTTTNQ